MNKHALSAWLTVITLFLSQASGAELAQLRAVNLATGARNTRLLFDFSKSVTARVGQTSPLRLAISVPDATSAIGIKQPPATHALIGAIQTVPDRNGLRLDVDLKTPAKLSTFKDKNGTRVVVELSTVQAAPAAPIAKSTAAVAKDTRPAASVAALAKARPAALVAALAKARPAASVAALAEARPAATTSQVRKAHVIAIDAGHGGKDTGAIGPHGLREKDVVFAIARKLAGMIQAEPDMKAVLIRKNDEFIELRERANIARKAHADLFVSLHADAYINGDARGSSVFTLSRNGASSVAARWLADKENAVDLMGGVKLRGKDKVLASVLLDLSQNASLEAGNRAADKILRALEKHHRLHNRDVQKAGFVVLKSPDVPSLLVETGFISNPDEERKLGTQEYQLRIARSLFNGVRAYFARRPPTPSARPKQPDAERVIVAERKSP